MSGLWYILWFLIAVSLLVAIHEYGHYWAARKLGFKVLRFSVGFGRPLLSRTAGADQTEYVLAAIPLGGYVKLLDEREGPVAPEDRERAFMRKHPWKRIVVLFAGPAFNIGFAILLLWGMLWVTGSPEIRPLIGTVVPDSIADRTGLRSGDEILTLNGREIDGQGDVVMGLVETMSGSGIAEIEVQGETGTRRTLRMEVADPETRRALTEPTAFQPGLGFSFWQPAPLPIVRDTVPGGTAAQAGLQKGDEIVAIDGTPVRSFLDVVRIVTDKAGQEVLIDYRREGRLAQLRVPVASEQVGGQTVGRIGVQATPAPLPENMRVVKTFGPVQALGEATVRAWEMTVLQAKMFWRMIMGQVSLKNLSGPISIAEYAGDSARGGVYAFLGFLVLISLSLGFLNLLPIPILDGGQIVYQCAEWVKGSPLSDAVQAIGQQVGIALLLLLMGVALYNDVARQFG